MQANDGVDEQRRALADRLFTSLLGTLEVYSVFLGWRLGLYELLVERPTTPDELASLASIHPRYAREWLEQQAVAGILAVDSSSAPAEERRYVVPDGHLEVLVHPESVHHLAPLSSSMVGIGRALPDVVEAYRTGAGVPYERYGREFRDGQGAGNRPAFAAFVADWIAEIPDLDERLRDGRPARIADVACGHGWSSIALARAYPHAHVDGIDADPASIEEARAHLAGTGVEARVNFHVADAATLAGGPYELVTIFEALHDMARPVEALASARRALAEAGALLVVDERVSDVFDAPGGEIERFWYGWSVSHCLPASMAEQPSAALGTVLRAPTLRALAAEAGLVAETLPIDNDLWRFYLLKEDNS